VRISYLFEVGPKKRLSGKFPADPQYPDFEITGAKSMKNLKSIICAALLVTALSVSTFATTKSGQISTTRTGQISTTKTGQISTTKTGQISTTRTGQISTTGAGLISVNGFQLLDLLVTFINVW